MKILLFLPSYTLTIERGDTTHIKELASNLSRLAEIDVIKANGVKASGEVLLMTKILRVIRGFTKAVFLILKRRPDIIYTRGSQCIFTIPLAKLFGLPMIVEINGLFLEEWLIERSPSGINGWITYAKGVLNDKTFKYADHLVVVAAKIKNILEVEYKINPEKISVIENGANTELFRPMNTKKARKELKLNETYNYICFVGSLFKRQGVEYLIKASPYILEKCPQSVFLVIGDGPSRESLTNLAEQLGVSGSFIFTGAKPYTSVPLYINAIDLCVAPFVSWERNIRIAGSPLKLHEYLACGKPVVASDIEEVQKLLAESNAGICVPAESPRELANAVVGLLRDPKTRKSMGENGRRHIVENRSWESVARKVLKVCQMVVQKRCMKILLFLPSYTLTIERGDTTHIKELASNLSRLAEIDVIKANGVKASGEVLLITKILRIMRGFTKAVFLILKRRPDIIYTRGSLCIFTIPLAKLFGLPMIVEINGLFLDEWLIERRPSGINGWITYVKGVLNDKTFKYADHLVVVTPEIKNILEVEYKINPEKISVIENGANTELFRPMNTKEARKELKLNETHDYICFVGNIVEWQGIQYLIKASPYILEEHPNTFFLIVGDGPFRESLTNLAEQLGVSDSFIFTGAKPYTTVPLYINASDLCVVSKKPLRSGFSPLKLYEYMACGKPTVATRTSGFEVLEEKRAGLLVNPEDPNEFATTLNRVLSDHQLGKELGENGRRHIVENRSWESVAGKVFKLCQMVVQKR